MLKILTKINWKRIVSVFLILIFQISSYPFAVFAQEATQSGQLVTTPNNLPVLLEQTTLDASSSAEALSATTSAIISEIETPETIASAQIKLPVRVHSLRKKNFRADEKITIVVANAYTADLKITLLDSNGQEISAVLEELSDSDPAAVRLIPPPSFKPGKYRLQVSDEKGTVLSNQDFTWGVLAINTNKSIYSPFEEAKLAMAVLDETGIMVCDAKVNLEIKNQEANINETLSTENGKIIVNPECKIKDFTLKPDYEASYKVGDAGVYEMELVATTDNGTYSISDAFEVRSELSFDVERVAPTRIYPPKNYPVKVKIQAREDFQGVVKETVPSNFGISQLEGVVQYQKVDEYVQGETETEILEASIFGLGMPFEGSFEVGLGFGGQHKDPTLSTKYTEFGVIGHDGIDFPMASGTPVLAVDDGEVVKAQIDDDYGTTIVIQHSWGKSYYGHLSELLVEKSQIVSKGEQIALSGSTGLSSGPHLHFGLKPNVNDFGNGYYGKVDPAPFLALDTFSNQPVLGTSTEASLDQVKVLQWRVDIKKGEEITLGYQFKAPNTSPYFYLLGPAEFIDNDGKVVFQEARLWQIAADATLPTLVPGAGATPNGGDADTATSNTIDNEGGTACNATDCYTSVDETIASTDNGTTFLANVNNNNATRVQGFELTETPSDFSTMDTLTIDVRVQRPTARTNDDIVLLAQVFENGGSTALTNQVTVCTLNATTDDCGTTWNTITKTFTLQGNNSKTVWDSAELHMTWSTTKTGPADGTEVQVSTAELDGTYTQAAAGPTMDQVMRHGKWFNAGAEAAFTF